MGRSKKMMRIDDELRKCLAEIIRFEKDNLKIKHDCIVSVLKAEASKDLRWCKVFISVFGYDNKKELVDLLNESERLIRKLVAQKLNLRFTPEFVFCLDEGIEYSMQINDLLNKIK